MSRPATHAEIRAFLGHGTGSRRVKIAKDGSVSYYGSKVDTDRQHDYWHEAGHAQGYGVDTDGTVHANRKTVSIGRPPSPEGRIAIRLTLPPYVAEWLKGSGNASGEVRALVDEAIEAKRRERK